MAKKYTALGAYIFAGGFTLGVKQHFKILAHLEEGPYGVATMRHNQPEIPVYYGPEAWPLEELKKQPIDFLYGNPPCAAWSQMGKVVFGADWRTDPRVDCARRHFTLLEDLRPTIWVWESVCRAFTAGRELVDSFTTRALELGYSVTYLLHNAQYLGCPQDRARFFFVAHRAAFEPALPAPEWTTISVKDVIGGLNDPGEQDVKLPLYEYLFEDTAPGEGLRSTWERAHPNEKAWKRNHLGHVIGRPSFATSRTYWNEPSHTVSGHAMVHPLEGRCLTTKEMAMLCGFPPDYEFVGSGKEQQIARGVCPTVGEWLSVNVKRSLKKNKTESGNVYLVDLRKPPAQRVQLPAPTAVAALTSPVPVAPSPAKVFRETTASDVKQRPGSGAFIRELLRAGALTPAQIVESVHAAFPQSKATVKDVYWNRRKLQQDEGQAQATRKEELPRHVDPERDYDKTSLTSGGYGYRVHRDYAAHFFRWGFAKRFITNGQTVLEVGCGQDFPFVKTLIGGYADGVPKTYVGVDLNPLTKPPSRPWATFYGAFNFIERHRELARYDVLLSLEVIEHMTRAHGQELLVAMRAHLKKDGRLLLSTPVFDGKAAANHIHEYTVPELQEALESAGFKVLERYGTFANYRAIKKVATPAQVATLDALNRFYSTDVTACFLAPLYPDASRNNVWVCAPANTPTKKGKKK